MDLFNREALWLSWFVVFGVKALVTLVVPSRTPTGWSDLLFYFAADFLYGLVITWISSDRFLEREFLTRCGQIDPAWVSRAKEKMEEKRNRLKKVN